jgi:hypothetical protein
MNISPNNELYAVATDNEIKIGDLLNGSLHVCLSDVLDDTLYSLPCPLLMHIISLISQRDFRGHIGEITTLQFFPSGQGMQYKKERNMMYL